jgi:aromatic ring-cleaving dioxygenase
VNVRAREEADCSALIELFEVNCAVVTVFLHEQRHDQERAHDEERIKHQGDRLEVPRKDVFRDHHHHEDAA